MNRNTLTIVADRNAGIGGTDARIIASGEGWHQLYLEKTGQAARPDLTYAWKPRLGLETESLHAWWHGHSEGVKVENTFADFPVTRQGIPEHHFATYDRFVLLEGDADEPLEMKHTNERNNLRDAASYYMAQLQWQMHIGGYDQLRFSIIRGNSEPEWGHVARDQDYIDRLIEQVEAFWWHVTAGEAPDPDVVKAKAGKAGLAARAAQVPLNGFKPYDRSTDNLWCAAAADFIRDKVAAESLKASEPLLRGMIPVDAETVTGGGVSFKRDARGAYRVTIDEDETAAWRARLDALMLK